ncbi:MAG: hypothetical protein J6P61_04520 [Erysipelotrichaceae bacterium]|nr:hypothetical protein [Erysipelotrichaceae bacterium]
MELEEFVKTLPKRIAMKAYRCESLFDVMMLFEAEGIDYPEDLIAGTFFVNPIRCPYCESVNVVEIVNSDGSEGYRCLDCGQLFTI